MLLQLDPVANLLSSTEFMAVSKKRFSLYLLPPCSGSHACINCQSGVSECQLKSNLKNHIVFLAELMK